MVLEQQTHTNIDHNALYNNNLRTEQKKFLGNLNFKFSTVRLESISNCSSNDLNLLTGACICALCCISVLDINQIPFSIHRTVSISQVPTSLFVEE